MKIFNKNQNGFTLVELVVVVAVVGVLAVVATPKIVGVATDARKASLAAVAGALESASANNYAAYSLKATGTNIQQCQDVGQLLSGGLVKLDTDGYRISTLDEDYKAADEAYKLMGLKDFDDTHTDGTKATTCTLHDTTGLDKDFSVIGIGGVAE